jgi:NAD(P)H dehydrogenase (quinone)
VNKPMIVVTGATGQLGRLVIVNLLKRVPATQIVAAARTPSKAADLAALGVHVREADYGKPATLAAAFAGATSILLISSPALPTEGVRVSEHKAVIDAAKAAGAQLLAYTSVLRAETSTLLVGPEHLATERHLIASGIPWVLLRHGSYLENHTASLGPALQSGTIVGSAGKGRFAAAARADYAEAAAVVLTTPGHAGKIYELGGDVAYTLAELASEVGKQSGKKIVYNNLPERAYQEILESVGLPADLASFVADSDTKATQGELDTSSRDLSGLIGHPTTTLAAAVGAALAQ